MPHEQELLPVPQYMMPVTPLPIPQTVQVKTEPHPRRKRRRTTEPNAPAAPVAAATNNGRQRKAAGASAEPLNQEQLLSMNSVELGQLIAAQKEQGLLSSDGVKAMKKVLRQVKNRESAQESRLRKRDYVETMKAELEHEKKVSSTLREYVTTLQGLLSSRGIEVPPEPEMPVFVPPEPSELTVASRRPLMRPLRTAGICLMVVVLSVGLFFNAVNRMDVGSTRHVNATAASVTTAPVDSQAATLVPPVEAPQPPPSSQSSSVLLSGHESQEPTVSAERKNASATSTCAGELVPESTYLSFDTEQTDSSLALVVPAPTAEDGALVPRKTRPVMHRTSKALFGHAEPRVADRSWALDNSTSYILVNDATEFVPPCADADADALALRTEPVIGLLLPAASFNLSNCEPGDVVELVCRVRNANVVPRSVFAHSLH